MGKQDFTIKQSPTVLNSARSGGTTGAVVWKVTPRFAEWIASADNVLFRHDVLSSSSVILELGSGIAGIVPVMLAPKVGKYFATDQIYALKLLKENIAQNSTVQSARKGAKRSESKQAHNLEVTALDWETDDAHSFLKTAGVSGGIDMIIACDCIYNYALIQPFVQTCVDACRMREAAHQKPTICVVAQQLRQPDVFEEWLEGFSKHFRTWRLSDEFLTPALGENSGFVVHLGVLREALHVAG